VRNQYTHPCVEGDNGPRTRFTLSLY